VILETTSRHKAGAEDLETGVAREIGLAAEEMEKKAKAGRLRARVSRRRYSSAAWTTPSLMKTSCGTLSSLERSKRLRLLETR